MVMDTAMDISGSQTSKKKKNLCQHESCRRKLGIVPFECRCGKAFCGEHRLSENHNCPIDYKALHRAELLKTMSSPIVGIKVEVI